MSVDECCWSAMHAATTVSSPTSPPAMSASPSMSTSPVPVSDPPIAESGSVRLGGGCGVGISPGRSLGFTAHAMSNPVVSAPTRRRSTVTSGGSGPRTISPSNMRSAGSRRSSRTATTAAASSSCSTAYAASSQVSTNGTQETTRKEKKKERAPRVYIPGTPDSGNCPRGSPGPSARAPTVPAAPGGVP